MTQLAEKKIISFYIPQNNSYLDCHPIKEIKLSDHTFFNCSERAWIVQTYLHLKNISDSIICSSRLLPDAINVLHCDEMLKSPDIGEYFTVSIVADRRVYLGGNLAVVQNHDQTITSKDRWIMHWPQTNLIASTRTGKESTFRIGFLGLKKNSIDLKKLIDRSKYKKEIEVVFRGPGEWHDYSDLDAVVAIRDFKSTHPQKPPTKLLNAWRAGVVFLGGKDSAYEQVGRPNEDYIRCGNADELLFEIERLVGHPEIIEKLIAAGYESVSAYTDAKIVKIWRDFFKYIAEPELIRWQKRPFFFRKLETLYRSFMYLRMRVRRSVLSRVGMY